jgi:hypothetical protein
MKAIGKLAFKKVVGGKEMVNIFYNGNWFNCGLENEDDMPLGHPHFGLFEFEPADQFCKWIDPNKV